jgi:hypothetical protein
MLQYMAMAGFASIYVWRKTLCVCVCKRIYSGEGGCNTEIFIWSFIALSDPLKSASHIILNVHVYSLYFVVMNKILFFFISHEIITCEQNQNLDGLNTALL